MPTARGAASVDSVECSPAERALLWNRSDWLSEADAASIQRTAEWEAWRFAPASLMRYRWLSVREDGELLGYAVWGMDLRAPVALLSELCAPDPRVCRALVAKVVADARDAGLSFVSTATTIGPVRDALVRNGFLRRARLPFIVRTLSSRVLRANVHSHGSWQLLGADLDTY
jgi:hypothetical protein